MILSLHGGHNASAAVIRLEDGRIRSWCVEAERIDRIKMSYGCERYNGNDFSPQTKSNWLRTKKTDFSVLIDHVMNESHSKYGDIELIVLSQNTDISRIPSPLRSVPTQYVKHHHAHAALAFYTSPFDDALAIVCDGSGERLDDGFETQTSWSCCGNIMRQLSGTYKKNTYNMGIGNAYELYTYWLGYGYNGCGTTMALASFGQAEPKNANRIFTYHTNGDIFLNPQWVDVAGHVNRIGYIKHGTMAYNQDHERMLRSVPLPDGYRLRNRGEPSLQPEFIRMATDIQYATEEAVIFYVEKSRSRAPEHHNLCLGGGTFLNCNLNSKLRMLPWVKDIHVPTAPGDGGLALGGALAVYFMTHDRCPVEQTVYIGTAIRNVNIEDDDTISLERTESVCKAAAQLIAEGKLVGWCQGRAEFGPRALGHRSLLADPTKKETPARINRRLKHREPFRPFAPSVLLERFCDYFEGPLPLPFMLETRRIRADRIDIIPAVCHVDHSARVQIVSAAVSPKFHALLKEFDFLTGTGVLVNTSLNRNGEPIVDSGEDALLLLRQGMLDALVINDSLYLQRRGRA